MTRGIVWHFKDVLLKRRLKAANDRKQAAYEAAQAHKADVAARREARKAAYRLAHPLKLSKQEQRAIAAKALADEMIAKALRRG